MTDADDNTRLSRRGTDAGEHPEDSTQLVSRRDRRNASVAAEATDATAIVPRETPVPPADETVIVDRASAASAQTASADHADDRTALVRRPVESPASPDEDAPASDEADAGTLLVRRPTPATDATVVVPRAAPVPAGAPDDEHTILTPRSPAAADALDADDTVLRPRDEPQDATLLRRRDRPTDADADADADDTVLRARDTVADDATSLSPRGTRKSDPSPRLTRARRGAATQTASFAPDAETDRTPARERYAIRTPTIRTAPATAASASASPVVDLGDGGLAARIARRRATRMRLTVLAGVSAVVFVGSIVGLATLLSI